MVSKWLGELSWPQPSKWVPAMFASLYEVAIGKWLWMLFRHGPLALGFWKGLSDADICARISKSSEALDWVHPVSGATNRACENMIAREFTSFTVVVHIILYILAIVVAVSGVKQYMATRIKVKAQSQAYAAAMHQQLQLQTQLQTPHHFQLQLPPHPAQAQAQVHHPQAHPPLHAQDHCGFHCHVCHRTAGVLE